MQDRTLPSPPQGEAASMAEQTKTLLRKHYSADLRPWVVAYSGGKDSTLVLQLVYELILELGPRAAKPVHVIASDTRVEAPNVETYLSERLTRIESHARANGVPVKVHRVRPSPEQGFWGNLIGKGYPSPTRWFRWCTTKMKIKPSRAAIESIVREQGGVVLLLGTRLDESASRARRMEARATNERGLNPHGEIPDALVMTPIADWSTDQVWEYLFTHNPPPWGGTHDYMLDLYRQASGGECPVVLDLNTPSCGGSRFGCWTCTVVKEDKSMRGFIDSGEDWMAPLAEFRNWLKQIREDPTNRDGVRRNEAFGTGPFTSEMRKEILRRLLAMEKAIGRRLIEDEEIAYIQRQWADKFDVNNTALSIAREHGREVGPMPAEPEEKNTDVTLIEELAPDYEVQSIWATDLYRLVNERYPTIDTPSSQRELVDEVKKVIGNAVRQAQRTESAE